MTGSDKLAECYARMATGAVPTREEFAAFVAEIADMFDAVNGDLHTEDSPMGEMYRACLSHLGE